MNKILIVVIVSLLVYGVVSSKPIDDRREFICADGRSVRYQVDMHNPEILCGVLNLP
jgi:hypothetical protein